MCSFIGFYYGLYAYEFYVSRLEVSLPMKRQGINILKERKKIKFTASVLGDTAFW